MTMFDDLTKVNVPFGLLDRETQEALKAHGGPYEVWVDGVWKEKGSSEHFWAVSYAYRVKPAPPKPREWWLVVNGGLLARYDTKHPTTIATREEVIHVREVLPND